MQIGDIITFGSFEWVILDIEKDKALIFAKDILEQREFHNRAVDVCWADSEIRYYLNHAFFDAFSAIEKSRIIAVTNKNDDNNWYGTEGGTDTEDRVFLLSMEEVVCKFFGDSSDLLMNRSPKQRYWFQRKDKNNPRRTARYNGYIWWWWLRTPGRSNRRAVYIHGDGNIGIQGNGTYKYSSNTIHPTNGDNRGGIRPALWLKI